MGKSCGAVRPGADRLSYPFIFLGAMVAAVSVVQYEKTLKNLGPEEIPDGYRLHMPTALNAAVGLAGVALLAYLLIA